MNLFKKKEIKIVAPITGKCIPIEEVDDPVFSGNLMGEGVAIKPSADKLVSPCQSQITVVSETGHAFGLRTSNGLEIMIHIGIDTVNRKGKGFHVLVEQGKEVRAGETLVQFDREEMEEEGIDTSVMVVFLNGNEFLMKDLKKNGGVREGKDRIALLSKK